MSDTTNLADLPTNPVMGDSQNIVLQTRDSQPQYSPNVDTVSSTKQSAQTSLEINDQKLMNEFITGIQQASASGATSLPSRDIPNNTTVHFADEQIQPNFVPRQEQSDYIHTNDTEQDILARRMNNKNSRDSLEILYDEFQIPIIIGLLYFIFQLPVVRSKFLTILPSLHNNDGNPNLSGYILNSVLFGVLYYVFSKVLVHLHSI
jgi:hypothetical protein